MQPWTSSSMVGELLNLCTSVMPNWHNIVDFQVGIYLEYNYNGMMAQHKAQLVIYSFMQAYGIYYMEILSHVVPLKSIYVLLSLWVSHQNFLHQLDISKAFMYKGLEDDVFLKRL